MLKEKLPYKKITEKERKELPAYLLLHWLLPRLGEANIKGHLLTDQIVWSILVAVPDVNAPCLQLQQDSRWKPISETKSKCILFGPLI